VFALASILAIDPAAADEPAPIESPLLPLPRQSYVRFDPSLTWFDDGGHAAELDLRGVLAYRGWLVPALDAERVSSALGVDLALHHERAATGLGDLELTQLSGVTFGWGTVGAGLVLGLPTATNDRFGSGAARLGPAWFFQAAPTSQLDVSLLARTFVAFAGAAATEAALETKLEPGIVVTLARSLFLSTDAEIEINWLAHTGRFPINLELGVQLGSHLLIQIGPGLDVAGRERGSVTIDMRIDWIDP
jgi:hypothetical protein